MVIRFDGQVAIVTGSGRGLGAAYARLLAERGASVVVHDAGMTLDGTGFDSSVADAVVHEITTTGKVAVPCYEHIESREGCQRLIDVALNQFGRLDIQIAAHFWLLQAAFPPM
jgi:NAD(P)-dependent dehydrogenase (short-subunit alcohol dehydrogenase family)